MLDPGRLKGGDSPVEGGWRRFRLGPERRRRLGWAAAILFFAVAGLSLWKLPPVVVRWPWLGCAALLILVTVSLLAGEYRISAWLIGRRVGWKEALSVTILSSAANLLPLPGGLAVRTGALRRKGSGWTAALGSNLVMGLGWLGVALLLAAILLRGEAAPFLAAGFAVVGLLVIGGMAVALGRLGGDRSLPHALARVLLLEGAYVAVTALRLWVILRGLGILVSFGQATTLTVASALAAGLGFFPGGLGLRELLAGALAPLVGLAPAVGAFAGVVDRVIGMSVRGLLAAILWRISDLDPDTSAPGS